MGICKFLYLINGELLSNFGTVKTFIIHYFVIKSSGKFGTEYSGINIM